MVIGIDGNETNVQEKVGVSVYTFELLNYFSKVANDKLQFKTFLKNSPLRDLPHQTNWHTYEVVRGSIFWSQFFLPLRLNLKRDIEVFFTPAHYAPRFCPVPLVVTIHDLSYFYFSEEFLKKDLYKLKNWTKYSVEKAKKIIAVSNNTKQDLIKFYSVPESKIEVIYNGYEKRTINLDLRFKNYDLIKNYILYVGTLQPRKNIPILIHAFNKFRKNNPDLKLVITGKKGWLYEEIFNLVKKLALEKDVIFTGYVADERLAYLYRNAFCFVLPSLYEGFGLPVLEAMSFDCPVISSNSSSLPEVGGDACLYFDPKSKEELLKRLEELKNNEDLRKNLIEKGRERIKLFSWQKCANQTLKIIKSVA